MLIMRLLFVSSFLATCAVLAASNTAAADPMADAKAIIEQHRAMPVFTPPGEPFDA